MRLDERIMALLKDKRMLLVLGAILCALVFLPSQENMTQEERRISHTLSQIAGAGRVRVTIYYSENSGAFGSGKSCVGAVAVSEGAGDIGVRLRLTEAIKTLLGLEAEAVVVLKMEESR